MLAAATRRYLVLHRNSLETPPPPASSSFEPPLRDSKGRPPQGVELVLPRSEKRAGTLRHTFEDLRCRSLLPFRQPRASRASAPPSRRCRPRRRYLLSDMPLLRPRPDLFPATDDHRHPKIAFPHTVLKRRKAYSFLVAEGASQVSVKLGWLFDDGMNLSFSSKSRNLLARAFHAGFSVLPLLPLAKKKLFQFLHDRLVWVFQLKVNGMAFRLIPEQSEVKNALQVREKSGSTANSFPVVPVFQ